MTFKIGETIRSTWTDRIQGEVVGYGMLTWPADPDPHRAGVQNGDGGEMQNVYLVKVAEHSMHGQQACIVLRASHAEKV